MAGKPWEYRYSDQPAPSPEAGKPWEYRFEERSSFIPEGQTLGGVLKNVVTGEDETQFPDVSTLTSGDLPNLPGYAPGKPGPRTPMFSANMAETLPGKLNVILKNYPELRESVRTDKFGNYLITLPSGEARYLDSPGLTGASVEQAFDRGLLEVPGFALGAMTSGSGPIGWGLNALGAGAGYAGAKTLQRMAADAAGAQENPDYIGGALGDFGSAAAAQGIGGPIMNWMFKRVMPVPKFYNPNTGEFTQDGIIALKNAFPELSDDEILLLTKNQTLGAAFQSYMRETTNPDVSARRALGEGYGMNFSNAQITQDPAALMSESVARQGGLGQNTAMEPLSRELAQLEALRTGAEKVGEKVAGGTRVRAPGEQGPDIQAALVNTQADDRALLDDSMLKAITSGNAAGVRIPLFKTILKSITNSGLAPANIPKTFDLLKSVTSENRLASAAKANKASPLSDIFQLRQRLSAHQIAMENAGNRLEVAATKNIIREVDDVLDNAVTSGSVIGDQTAIRRLKNWVAEDEGYRRTWANKDIVSKLVEMDKTGGNLMVSPEQAANTILGRSGVLGNNRLAVQDLNKLRTLLPDEQWNQIKSEVWSRLWNQATPYKSLNPMGFVNAWKDVVSNHNPLLKTIFTPGEMAEINLFSRAIQQQAGKAPGVPMQLPSSGFINDLLKGVHSNPLSRAALHRVPLAGPIVDSLATRAAEGALFPRNYRGLSAATLGAGMHGNQNYLMPYLGQQLQNLAFGMPPSDAPELPPPQAQVMEPEEEPVE